METESESSMNKSGIPQIVVSENKVEDSSPSPFDDEHEHATTATETTVDTIPNDDHDDDDDDDDDDYEYNNRDDDEIHFSTKSKQVSSRPKSPRISAFNLLKNESDDEDDNGHGENDDDDDDEMNELSPEQKEEIRRMKSVYKVYFDNDAAPQQPRQYEVDGNHPPVPVDKINNELKWIQIMRKELVLLLRYIMMQKMLSIINNTITINSINNINNNLVHQWIQTFIINSNNNNITTIINMNNRDVYNKLRNHYLHYKNYLTQLISENLLYKLIPISNQI